MPRRAEFLPKIERELRRGKPVSTQDIAAKVGCSNQQVHKAVTGTFASHVKRDGTSPTGGFLYVWGGDKPDVVARARARRGAIQEPANIELGDVYRVVEVRVREKGSTVVLETKTGRQITVAS